MQIAADGASYFWMPVLNVAVQVEDRKLITYHGCIREYRKTFLRKTFRNSPLRIKCADIPDSHSLEVSD